MKNKMGPEEEMARAFLERGGRVVSTADGDTGSFERRFPDQAEAGALRELATSLGFDVTGDAHCWSARLAYQHVKDGLTVERRILWHGRVQTGHDSVAIEEGWYDGGDIDGGDDRGA
jgi:hypothetical protein